VRDRQTDIARRHRQRYAERRAGKNAYTTDVILCIIQMSLSFIMFGDVLQYNIVNVIIVSCCHIANTNQKEYNYCCLYSLGGRQPYQNFELNGLVTLLTLTFQPLDGVTDHPCHGNSLLPIFSSLLPSFLDLGSGMGQTDRKTDRQCSSLHNAYALWGRRHNRTMHYRVLIME